MTALLPKPIAFSGPLVKKLIIGKKTQTRRPVRYGWTRCLDLEDEEDRATALSRHPYGAVGGKLYVKEAWRTAKNLDDLSPTEIGQRALDTGYARPWAPMQYEADKWRDSWDDDWPKEAGRYRHARFMPRWASRIALQLTNVELVPLQSISTDDVAAEGIAVPAVDSSWMDPAAKWRCAALRDAHARIDFVRAWDNIYAEEHAGAFEDNPWVWKLTFRQCGLRPAEVR